MLVGPSAAHEEISGVTNVLDAIEPPLPDGVTLQVTRSVADQVVVENATTAVLEVLSDDGQAFLRIGPQGVQADVGAPEWHRSNVPEGSPSDQVSADQPQNWVQISTQPTWGWFDHRLHRAPVSAPPRVEPGETVVLERWEIPLRLAEQPIRVTGRRVYSRPAGHFRHAVTEQIPGTEAAVLDGQVPAIFLRLIDESGRLTLIGETGEPFARMSEGLTEVNEASRTWTLTARSRGGFDPNAPVGGAERWRTESTTARLTWLEPRAVPDREGSNFEWSVPALRDGRPVALRGRSIWVPTRDPDKRGLIDDWRSPALGAAGLLALAVGAGAIVRRRRSQAAAPDRQG